MRQATNDRSKHDVGHHLERQGSAQHYAGIGSCHIVGQQR
jgi:hypothetical protein